MAYESGISFQLLTVMQAIPVPSILNRDTTTAMPREAESGVIVMTKHIESVESTSAMVTAPDTIANCATVRYIYQHMD